MLLLGNSFPGHCSTTWPCNAQTVEVIGGADLCEAHSVKLPFRVSSYSRKWPRRALMRIRILTLLIYNMLSSPQ